MVSEEELNSRKEPNCTAILADRKYYRVGNSCVKRTLRRHEWQSTEEGVLIVPPTSFTQRWTTDAAVIQYLGSQLPQIPLPHFQCVFEDDGAFYHLTEYVEGISMSDLEEDQKAIVTKQVEHYVRLLHSLESDRPGVPGGNALMCPPQRVTSGRWRDNSAWKPLPNVRGKFVFCHNDLGQHNIIVDPATLQVKAIIDWEFAGFWPEWFDRPYWRRAGPSGPMDGEEDDTDKCRDWLLENCEEIVVPAF